MLPDTSALDSQLTERLDLLLRWTRAIRHDLGNVIYPSRSLIERAAQEGDSGKKLGGRVADLADMMETSRAVLGYLRPLDATDADGAVIAAEWWTHTKGLLRSIPKGPWEFSGPSRPDRALPVSACGLTHLALAVTIAVDLQVEQNTGGEFEIEIDGSSETAARMTASATFSRRPQLLQPIRQISDVLGASVEDHADLTRWVILFRWD